MSFLNKPLFRFAVVGGVGFIVDASVLSILIWISPLGLYYSRIVSFLVAVSVTWSLNRKWTFKQTQSQRQGRKYFAYLAIQIFGALINFGTYAFFIKNFEFMARFPIIALAIGSLIALVFNFSLAKKLVFMKPNEHTNDTR